MLSEMVINLLESPPAQLASGEKKPRREPRPFCSAAGRGHPGFGGRPHPPHCPRSAQAPHRRCLRPVHRRTGGTSGTGGTGGTFACGSRERVIPAVRICRLPRQTAARP